MKTRDKIIAPSRGTAGQAKAYGVSGGAHRPDDCRAYVQAVSDLCQPDDFPDFSVVIGQSLQETTEGSAPWASFWWTARLNPAGLGITGDPAQNAQSPRFQNGIEAAAAQVAHLLVYALGPVDAGSLWFRATGTPIRDADPRYDAYLEAYGNTVQAETIAELAGSWAMDPLYAQGVVRRGNDCFAGLPDQDQGATPVGDHTTTIPGLPGGPLVTDYPILITLIPSSNTRQRPGIPARSPRRCVVHGTGNPNNADALAEARWFVNGADGGQASVHYCVDDTKAVCLVPLGEVTWQAADGGGPGNMNGYSAETMEATAIWQDFGRRDRMIAIAADLMGRTGARLGVPIPERHWDFNWGECCDSPCDVQCGNRHHCPNQMMNTGLWASSFVPKWQAARADELRRMAGGTVATTTTQAPSHFPPHRVPAPDAMSAQGHKLTFNVPARFRCIGGGQFKTAPSRDAPNGVASPYRAGRTYTLDFASVVDREDWLVSRAGSWAPAKNFEKVT